ncbi:MAG: hypothetical protein ACPGTU_14675 [Myxococcota bacterium]
MFRILLVLILTGCGGNTKNSDLIDLGDPCEPGPDPEIEIGHGELRFESIDSENTQVELIHGPQGGYHSNIAIRAAYIDPESSYKLELTGTIDDTVMGETVPWISFRCSRAANALQSTGSLLIWDAEPEELHGKVAHVRADLYNPDEEDSTDDGLALPAASSTTHYTIWDPNLE